MPRSAIKRETFQSTAGGKGLDVAGYINKGAVPPELLGVHGKGGLSAIAHRTKQLKEIDNLVNDGVSDEIYMQFKDKNGVITTPFMHNGKLMRPNDKGEVRITDNGKIALAVKIDKYRRDRVDTIMKIVRLGDDIACYLFGVSEDTWNHLCSDKVSQADLDLHNIKMHQKLMELNCTVEYIESLPPSLTQTQSIAKLRKICEAFEKNVNQDDLTTISDTMSNMKDGHNNPTDITGGDNHPYSKEVQNAKDYAATGKDSSGVAAAI